MTDDTNSERTTSGIMSGVRVVELAAWVAGPAAAGILADWGADVIKVEPERGDPQRNVFGAVGVGDHTAMPPFEVDNRGKRSVVLDLRTDDGRASMERLLATADVFVTNTRVPALERLGLGPAAVRARHPLIVYGIVTGYGLTGPDAGRPGYDVGAFWARSALGSSFVPPGQLPPPLASGFGDHVTGMTLAGGIAGALFDRERSGRGHLVATSLLRAGIYGGAWNIGTLMRFGRLSRPRAREVTQTPLVNSYQAGDGHGFWLLGLEAERHWPGLIEAIERPDLLADERFATARDRARHAEAIVAELDVTFASRAMGEWVERFDAHDVWWAPINTPRSLLEDPQAEASGAFVDMTPRDGEEPFRAVATPIDFDDAVLRPGPVPRLGEHTADVLSELDR